MNKPNRTVGLAGLLALAVFAALALGSAATAGAITYQRCAKVLEAKTGNYTESKCLTSGLNAEWIRAEFPGAVLNGTEECARTTEAEKGMWTDSECKNLQPESKGEYVRLALASGVFTGTSGLSRLIAGGNVVRCTADTEEGSLSGKDGLSKVLVKFKSCRLESLETVTCKTPGAAEGEVVTASLSGRLGYVEVLGKKVGALLKPETGEEFTKGEISCGVLAKIKIRGSIIGEVTPINTFTSKVKLIFKVVEGQQEWREIQIEEMPQTAKLESSTNGGVFQLTQEESTEEANFIEELFFSVSA